MTHNDSVSLRTTDNNQGRLNIDDAELLDLSFIADNSINTLADKNRENLLIFPHCINAIHKDINGDDFIFHIQNKQVFTGNYLGFIGKNRTQISITSRFDRGDDNYFMHYMLQKIFALNVFDLKFSTNYDDIWDFLIYLFPYYLKKALRQGLLKKYKWKNHNDPKVKGTINIARNITNNIPFRGNIAYRTKEYDFDNNITQLIRHTIDYIETHKLGGKKILTIDPQTRQSVHQIIAATPSFNKKDRHSIIESNRRVERHPYYTEYAFLQQLCLKILNRQRLSYGQAKETIYGLLFDGAWLWEEYLNTILKNINFKHPQNRERSDAIFLFNGNKCARYPDFYKEDFILDAKYKRFASRKSENIDRDDMNQIISYLYISKASKGGFIFPVEMCDDELLSIKSLGTLNGYQGEIFLYGVPIGLHPCFEEFTESMNAIEDDIISALW